MSSESLHAVYMWRCLQLAALAAGHTGSNPMVGAVLVYEGRIIGEGYHQYYGGPHAEVNCIHSVAGSDQEFIPRATLYVSLEPCAHFGKTPPCADLVISSGIREVVIGCRDPFPAVNGRGIEKLQAAGIKLVIGVLEKECRFLNRRFFTFQSMRKPYIILKWAQTGDGYIGSGTPHRLMISNEWSRQLVHRWRSEEMSILVGTNTAAMDDPSLSTRDWPGKNPIRLVLDASLRLPLSLQLFDQSIRTLVFNTVREGKNDLVEYIRFNPAQEFVPQFEAALVDLNIHSVMVEGGRKLIQSFLDAGRWDELRIITNSAMIAGSGVPAPILGNALLAADRESNLLEPKKTGNKLKPIHYRNLLTDQVQIIFHPSHSFPNSHE